MILSLHAIAELITSCIIKRGRKKKVLWTVYFLGNCFLFGRPRTSSYFFSSKLSIDFRTLGANPRSGCFSKTSMHALANTSTGPGRSPSICQMAPAERKRRRTQYRRRLFHSKKTKEELPQDNPCTDTASSPCTDAPLDLQDDTNCTNAAASCSTPKAKRFRIPEPSSCPPAPKKRRVAPHYSPDKSSIPFFNPPDLEIFFFMAFRNISAWNLCGLAVLCRVSLIISWF